MDLGANMSAKLEPFLLMAKSAKGVAAAKLIKDATAAPGVFVFSELLEVPNIQDLSKSDNAASLQAFKLLELFAWGTYSDYTNNRASYPELNGAQITKLKYLSLVSLANDRRIIPYSDLLTILEMPTVRSLEDLIIDAIYLDVLRAKLDQKESQLEIEYTMGRDVGPGKIEAILAALQNWSNTSSSVLNTLDKKLAEISTRSNDQKKRSEFQEQRIQIVLKEVQDKQKDKGASGLGSKVRNAFGVFGGRGENREDMMDVDDAPALETSKGKNRKAPPTEPAKRNKRNRY